MTVDIFGKCDVCATNPKVASFADHHQRVIKVFEQEFSNYEHFSSIKSCKKCLTRAAFLNFKLSQICSKRYVNGNMQTDPPDKKEGEVKDENSERLQPHPYDCDCSECQIKFGNLPLLVQVIEGQEKASPKTSAANLPTPQSSSQVPDLSKPSTSTSVSPKRIMACPHCSKTFTHRGDFNKHVRKHTGEQPFTCRVCKRKFAHTSNLNRHLRVHSGDRPFTCDICNRNFSRKDKLDLHKKTKLCRKIGKKKS